MPIFAASIWKYFKANVYWQMRESINGIYKHIYMHVCTCIYRYKENTFPGWDLGCFKPHQTGFTLQREVGSDIFTVFLCNLSHHSDSILTIIKLQGKGCNGQAESWRGGAEGDAWGEETAWGEFETEFPSSLSYSSVKSQHTDMKHLLMLFSVTWTCK